MNHCVGSMKNNYALDKLAILKICLLKAETNFTQNEIKSLEETRFVLNK